MSEFVFKLPDLGEGTVEAEIVEWHVKPGDEVSEGQAIVDVMTDKANVEVPSPVAGRVLRTNGEPGDVVAVGSELIAFETSGKSPTQTAPPVLSSKPRERTAVEVTDDSDVATEPPKPAASAAPEESTSVSVAKPRDESTRVLTSPAIRKRAKEMGVDLTAISGTGPNGRILARDLDALTTADTGPAASPAASSSTTAQEVKVIGVRRVIAERLAQSKREIPHFAYVEEVDVTELEALRRHLNEQHGRTLSILPFIATALLRAIEEFPQCNAHYDAATGVLRKFNGVHLGVAVQTPDGLKVPVVKDAHLKSVWHLAEAIATAADRARSGTAKPGELSGSTITITSLGKLGGVASTPIINHPEVAIVGVNRIMQRPAVIDGQLCVRTMTNLSSSFDHRFVDGFDGAAMIQAVKRRLEHPATLFLTAPA